MKTLKTLQSFEQFWKNEVEFADKQIQLLKKIELQTEEVIQILSIEKITKSEAEKNLQYTKNRIQILITSSN